MPPSVRRRRSIWPPKLPARELLAMHSSTVNAQKLLREIARKAITPANDCSLIGCWVTHIQP
jgi:hypothetical protein